RGGAPVLSWLRPFSRRAPERPAKPAPATVPVGSMGSLPFSPAPFFANKDRAFWRLQFIGWGGVMVLRGMSAIANGQPFGFLVLVLIEAINGFSISLILSVIYGRLINLRPLITWSASAGVLAIAVFIVAFINGWANHLYQSGAGATFAQRVLRFSFI